MNSDDEMMFDRMNLVIQEWDWDSFIGSSIDKIAMLAAHRDVCEWLMFMEYRKILWTEETLADALGFSRGTLRNWRWRGGGPRFIKHGSHVMYPGEEVGNWMLQRNKRIRVVIKTLFGSIDEMDRITASYIKSH